MKRESDFWIRCPRRSKSIRLSCRRKRVTSWQRPARCPFPVRLSVCVLNVASCSCTWRGLQLIPSFDYSIAFLYVILYNWRSNSSSSNSRVINVKSRLHSIELRASNQLAHYKQKGLNKTLMISATTALGRRLVHSVGWRNYRNWNVTHLPDQNVWQN